MIEKLKYAFSSLCGGKRIRLACIAIITAITTVVVTLLSCSTYTVNIFDGKNTYTVRTLSKNISSALSGAQLPSDNYEIESSDFDGKTAEVVINYTFPVYITRGNDTIKVDFAGGTVRDVIEKSGFSLDEYDFVEPSADTVVNETTYIDFTDITYVSGEKTEKIPYATKTDYCHDILKGTVRTIKEGVDGSKKVEYKEKLVNGVLVERKLVSQKVLKKPVNAEKVVGTKVVNAAVTSSAAVKAVSWLTPSKPIALDAKGNPVNYKKKMTVKATAYTYTGHKCATGVAPKPGYIAVNPKVIPYGTKMYIKTPNGKFIYGYAVAADTGGFIKSRPTGVDLFMHTRSQCIQFGRRDVEIYILE